MSAITYAASFDCVKASSRTEILICSAAELSRLDDALDKTYWLAMEQNVDMPELINEQRWWLKDVRNKCPNSECLKNAYIERINKLQSPISSAPYVHSSYFVDLSPRSIDEELNGCFADTSCAKQAEVLVPAFSNTSNIHESELWSRLKNCLGTQSSMNTCAGYEQFVIRNELSEALREAIHDLPSTCRTAIVRLEAEWEFGINKYCTAHTNSEIGEGGTAWGGVYSSCKFDAFKERIRGLQISANALYDLKPISDCNNEK